MSPHPVQSLLIHFDQLFWLCKIFGIFPQELAAFQREHNLKKSKYGVWFVLFSMMVIIVFYSLLIYSFSDEDRSLKATQSTLTFVIGLFLTYIGLVMMATDQLTAIRNQKRLGILFERLRAVDERLLQENVAIDNSTIALRIRSMIWLTIVNELAILISTYVLLVDYMQWTSLLWIFSSLPTIYNSFDKIWFAVTLYALKQRFEAINIAMEDMVRSHEKLKSLSSGEMTEDGGDVISYDNWNKNSTPTFSTINYEHNLSFLYKELKGIEPSSLIGSARNKITPITHSLNSFGEGMRSPQKFHQPKSKLSMTYESELSDIQRVEEKLNVFCQVHDEICEIGKLLNELWSYPILILMAYGFLIFTAQLYFLYCATQNQAIPSLFRSAKNAIITIVFLSYTAGKCIYLIYLSWKTSLESKRTGICLHKCGVTVDNNMLYEIVNHLSLKLLNHSVDFSACGFFTLDMETLYGVSGGITSYLIILIQFNLAAQQAKEAIHTFTNFNESANANGATGSINISTTLMDWIGSSTTMMTKTITDY